MPFDPPVGRRLPWAAAIACVAVALLFGVAKTVVQCREPPSWANGINTYEGIVAIDGFAHRAALVRTWLLELDEPSMSALLQSLRDGFHPTSLVGPVATALVSLTGLSVPLSYVLCTWLAFFGCLWLAVRLCTLLSGSRASPALVAVLAAHCLSLRTVGQLYQDWFVALAFLGTCVASIHWSRTRRATAFAAALACLIAGCFTKTSFAPALALPLLCSVANRARAGALGLSACLTLAPAAVAVLWVAWLGQEGVIARDSSHLLASNRLSWSRVASFAQEMVLLLQVFPILLFAHRRALSREALAVLTGAALMLASAAAFRLPVIPRLYLPVLVLMLPALLAAAPQCLEGRRLWLFVACNWVLGAIGLLVQ